MSVYTIDQEPRITTIEAGDVVVLFEASSNSIKGSTIQNLGTGVFADTDSDVATATAGAATLSKRLGVVTSEALTTAAAATYTLTITNTTVAAGSIVFASVANGTNTQGVPVIGRVTPGAGSVVILVRNMHASEALNGTIKVAFFVLGA